ncbi:MAG: NHLP bacteriocin export ABC transporter permease/ATPase subunit, partial [Thermodesulfobacteriota bacterium]
DASIRVVATDDFLAASRRDPRLAEARRLATLWIEDLARGMAPARRPRGGGTARDPGSCTLAPGEVLQAGREGLWLRVRAGTALLFGDPALSFPSGDAWLPFATSLWLSTADGATIEVADLATVLASERPVESFERAAEIALRGNAIRRRDLERAALADTTAEVESSRDELAGALAAAVSLFGRRVQRRIVSSSEADAVLAACQEIGWHAGLEFRRPPARRVERCKDPVDEISRASRVRYREVALQGAWWRRDNGPLLAFRRTAGAPAPVALLPRTPRSYRMVDPAAGTTVRVDERVAGELETSAYVFYRPLPECDVTARTLLGHALRGNRGEVLMILGMALLGGLIAMLTPIMTAVVFGTIVPAGEKSQLLQVAIGLVVAGLASAAFGLTKDFAILRLEGRADNGLEAAIWDRLLALPVEFFRGYAAGDLANRANGVNQIRQLLTSAALNAVLTGVFSIFSLAMIFYYSWKLAILAMVLAAIAVVVELLTGWGQLHAQRESANRAGRLEAIVLQLLTAVGKLRVAGGEARAFARWMEEYLEKTRYDIRTRLIQNASQTFSASYSILSMLLVFGVYYFFLDQTLETGDFLGFNAAFGQFMHAQLGAAGAVVSLVRTIPLFERARPILRALPETRAGRGDPGELTGEIEMRDVTFRYGPGLRPVLDGVSFKVRPGEYVAFVGSTGAGKTTILKLLLGFETPESGEVLYDGKDVRGLDPVALRRQLGIVLQDGRLLAGDVFHNIVGSTRLDEEDAWRAAEAAAIADEIRELPMGMHTYVSEGGRNVSGGQRQRLLIARALVQRPALLLLDEATSALDNESQAKVIASLDALGVTRVVIAHRLSTIRRADRIYVLDKGRLVQQGTFEELMAVEGPFRELAQRQIA